MGYSPAPTSPSAPFATGRPVIIMPELPEVETTRRGIAPHVVGRHVAELLVYDRRLRWPVPRDMPRRVRGQTIDAVERRSKYLLFRMGANTLLMHFGMTGSLRVYRDVPQRRPHDHIDIVLDDGTTLRYHDPRRFGAMLWLRGSGATHPLLRDLGPEPFDPAFNARHLWSATRGRRVAIKIALEVRNVLTEAIAKGGSTLRDYVDSRGEPGDFQLHYFVYDRAGVPCRVCKTLIRGVRHGQRASYYCPNCQK